MSTWSTCAGAEAARARGNGGMSVHELPRRAYGPAGDDAFPVQGSDFSFPRRARRRRIIAVDVT